MLPSCWAPTFRAMTNSLAVDVTGVTKSFGSICAVDDISVQVAAGEVYGVLGPNGAGKTTLLRMLFGLIRPDSGTIRVFGKTWDEEGVGVLDGVAGFIESPKFYPYLTGRQNLEGLTLLDGGIRPGLLEEILDVVDLSDRIDRKVGGYSYGMRQRLGVAASLLREPKLLVLDEPANGLDPAGIRDMRSLVKRLASSGLTVLLSSHDMDEVEEICDNVTILDRGSVAFHGTIAELRTMAPDPGHVLSTTDDDRALAIGGHHPDGHSRPRPGSLAGRDRPTHRTSRRTSPLWSAPTSTCSGSPRPRPRSRPCSSCSPTPPPRHACFRAPYRTPAGGPPMTAVTTAPRTRETPTLLPRRHPGLGAALRFEVRKLRAQYRAWAVLAGAVLAPIPIVVIIHGQSRPPKDTLFGRFATDNGFALALLVARVRHPVGATSADCHRRRRHLRQRGPARHLEDHPHPLDQPGPHLLGQDADRRRLRRTAARTARCLHHRVQPAHRRTPASDRALGPDHRCRHRTEAGHRELGVDASPDHRVHLPGDPALGVVPQPGRRHRRTGRARHGDGAGRRARRHRGHPLAAAHHPVRGLARPAHPTPVHRTPRRGTSGQRRLERRRRSVPPS